MKLSELNDMELTPLIYGHRTDRVIVHCKLELTWGVVFHNKGEVTAIKFYGSLQKAKDIYNEHHKRCRAESWYKD